MSGYDRTTILIVGLFLLGCVSTLTLAIFLFVCLITYIGLSLFLRGTGAHRYAFLAVLVPLQLFPLLNYKYSHFIVNDILGQESAGLSGLIIMVGLFFYTFQVVGFVVDTVIHKHPLPRFLQVTDERRNFTVTTNKDVSLSLSPEGAALLANIRLEARRRGIRVVYILPWAYAPEQSVEIQRKANSHFLDQVEAIILIIREPAMGVYTKRQDFADSGQHLRLEAAVNSSHCFGSAVGWIANNR